MKAYYIDGKTSKRRDSELTLHRDSIEIGYFVENQVLLKSIWEVEKIHKMEVRTSSRSLRYGDTDVEVLELISAEDFNAIIDHYPEAAFHQSTYNKFVSFGWQGIAFAIVAVIAVSALFFLYGSPIMAEAFARTIPKEYEIYIGENVKETYLQYFDVDEQRSRRIQDFFDELNYQSEYEISVVVVDSDVVNAFALPGGFIVVFSGILDIMDNEEELAALLAHEASHINERHSLRMMSRSLSTYLLISILTGDVGGFSSVLVENSNMVSSLSFSRSLEKEADMEGLNLMLSSKIDPSGMVELFKKFENTQDSTENRLLNELALDSLLAEVIPDSTSDTQNFYWKKTAELLSTHPTPDNRIEYLIEAIDNLPAEKYDNQDYLNTLFGRIKD